MIFIVIYTYSYVYLCIYTPSYQQFKAFPMSNFNSKTSFLFQLFKENLNFILVKPCKVISLSTFSSVHLLFLNIYVYIFMHLYVCMYVCMYMYEKKTHKVTFDWWLLQMVISVLYIQLMLPSNFYNTSHVPSRWSKPPLWWYCRNCACVFMYAHINYNIVCNSKAPYRPKLTVKTY